MTGKDRKDARNGRTAWKRYGAVFMAGIFLAGTAAAGTALSGPDTVLAEEEERLTLNVVDEEETEEPAEDSTEAETEEALEEETEDTTEEETEEARESSASGQIGAVETGDSQVVATDVSAIVENCMPSVVSVTNSSIQEAEPYYGADENEAESSVSGVIISQNEEELLIATDSYIVADSNDLQVTFSVDYGDAEEETVAARVKGMDHTYGLAVIAVQLSDIPEEIYGQLKVAAFGSSADLKTGQAVIALSNEPGYGQRVTSGIISTTDCRMEFDDLDTELFMIDASVNYASSGGAVLNTNGEVIGITIAAQSGEGSGVDGYAIPIDTAAPVLERLSNKETRDRLDDSERGYLGATVVNVSADAKELYNMPEGAFVYEVEEDSAAEEAGIKKGDIITMFDGETVTSSTDLIEKISYYEAGETVTIELQTANNGGYESREVEVTLQEGTVKETEAEDNTDAENNF